MTTPAIEQTLTTILERLESLENKMNVIITSQTSSTGRKTTTSGSTSSRRPINSQFSDHLTGKDGKKTGRILLQHMTDGPDEEWVKSGKPSIWPFDERLSTDEIDEIVKKDPKLSKTYKSLSLDDKSKEMGKILWKNLIKSDKKREKWIREYINKPPSEEDKSVVHEPDSATEADCDTTPKPKSKTTSKMVPKTAAKPAAKKGSKKPAPAVEADSASEVESSDDE